MWTAAGLTVHPVTRADSDDTAAPSLRLRVSRPTAHVDVTLSADGRCGISLHRPDHDATVHEQAHVDSAEAFGLLLDRVVELITWSGIRPDHGPPPGERSTAWVLGHDSNPLTH